MIIRLERFYMEKFQTQKLIRPIVLKTVNGCVNVSYSFQHINSYLSCLHGAPTGNAFSG
jgi:hypothetical protein